MNSNVSIPLENILLTLALALFPFYIFPSGGVQPSHLLLLIMSVLAILKYGVPRQIWIILLFMLSGYSLLVELFTGAMGGNSRFVINAAFFMFNSIIMVGVYRVVQHNTVATLRVGVIVAAGIAFLSVYLSGVDLREIGDSGRPSGTFNNPNQLGFFSVCILSLSYLLYIENTIKFSTLLYLIGGSIFLSVASLSKAAMVANFAVVIFALRPRNRGRVLVAWMAMCAILVSVVMWLISSGYLMQFVFFERIVNMKEEQDSSLAARGYFAFLDGDLVHLILGLGSIEVQRIVGHEVHSTFASVWNVYGVVGFCLFLPIFIIWGRVLYRSYGLVSTIAIMGPSLLYGITHNGVRFSIFWILVAASLGAAGCRLNTHSRAPRALRP